LASYLAIWYATPVFAPATSASFLFLTAYYFNFYTAKFRDRDMAFVAETGNFVAESRVHSVLFYYVFGDIASIFLYA
jgi:hypothetical protein